MASEYRLQQGSWSCVIYEPNDYWTKNAEQFNFRPRFYSDSLHESKQCDGLKNMPAICVALKTLKLLAMFLALSHVVRASPPTRKFEIPFLEEQAIGSEVHDLKEDLPLHTRDVVWFKLLKQYMTVGMDTVDDQTKWVNLDKDSGIISVVKPVDRERHCRGEDVLPCVVHVKIVQKPQKVLRWIDIELNVVDINDHPPVFPISPLATINVSESLQVTSRINIDEILATDADTGPNAEISYTLSRSNYFNIYTYKDSTGSPRLQLVVADDLDHEKTASYDLTLTATDHGTPEPRSSSITLRVRIVDVNDNPPVFDQSIYNLELQENIGPASVIIIVHAEDADSSNFGEIRYFVPVSGNSPLAHDLVTIDPVTGEVLLRESLDRERHNNIRVVIGARDLAGSKSKIGKTVLAIQVQDENDNAPVIQITPIVDSDNHIAYLSESSDVGTYVARVSAEDADVDMNGKVSMHISTKILPTHVQDLSMGSKRRRTQLFREKSWDLTEEENVRKHFVLDGDFIVTGKQLDRERNPAFLVTIVACDQAVRSLCSAKNLTIILLDENDNSPQFLNSVQEVTLREDADLGTLVASVEATDRDSELQLNKFPLASASEKTSQNGVIRYILHNGGTCFNIDEDKGRVRLVGALDYEKKKIWTLVVTAQDMGVPSKSANLSLTVQVTDVNDNAPMFSDPAVANQTVLATIQSGDVITKIHAVDDDEGDFSKVVYSIVSEDGIKSPPRIFILDRFTGNLHLNMSSPYLEDSLGLHSLVIKAQDFGSPPLSGYTTLRVEVYDVPLSVLPTFIKRVEEPPVSAEVDLSLILIVSLASAAILLVVAVSGIIFKCRKDSKEIRSYNCKSEESKKAWNLATINNTGSPNSAMLTPSNQLMTSRDSNINNVIWNQSMETQITNDARNVGDSRSNQSSQRSLRKKTNSVKNDSRIPPPGASQPDRDSGRGDSDHDAITETGSYEDRGETTQLELDRRRTLEVTSPLSTSTSPMVASDNGDLGPLCTHLCRQYGHSDTCWMHMADNQVQDTFYYHEEPLQSMNTAYYHQQPVHFANLLPMGGLETISETQPLHSVLRDDYDDDQTGNYQSIHDAYISPQSSSLHPMESNYYRRDDQVHQPTHWSNPLSPLDGDSNATTPSVTSPRQYPLEIHHHYDFTAPVRHHSASELYHGASSTKVPATDSSYRQYSVFDSGIASYDGHTHQGQSIQDSLPSTRRSTSSLHGELLHNRFLAHARGTSRADDVRVMSPNASSHYEEVSMQETQKIIDDIDQLIEN